MPTITGMSAYPDLELQYKNKYRAALRARGCGRCEAHRIVRVYRNAVEARRERDKLGRKS